MTSFYKRGSVFDDRWIPEPTTGCYLWIGAVAGRGYGYLRVNGTMVYAHRFVYERDRGKIPLGLFVLHKCDTPACVNPDHLFLGTHRDNVEDMLRKGRSSKAALKRRPRCPAGHLYSETAYLDKRGYRKCRVCRNAVWRRQYHRRKSHG